MSWLSDIKNGRWDALAKSVFKTFDGGEEGGGFLSGITGGVQSGLSNLLATMIFGNQSRISNEDFEHYQNLLDKANPREFERQSAFLEGVAPAQGNAYNTFQESTYGADTERYKERMDTLFPGTSPWERLGTSAASPLPSPAPKNESKPAGGFLQGLAPLATAEISADTQKQVAKIQQQTAKDVAKIHQGTELQKVGMQTNEGQLPVSQMIRNEAETFLANERAVTEGYTQNEKASRSNWYHNDVLLKSAKSFYELLPFEQVDLGLYKLQSRRGWQAVAEWSEDKQSGDTSVSLEGLLSKLPKEETDKLLQDTAKIAGIIGKVGKGSLHTAVSGGKFLGKLSRGFRDRQDARFLNSLRP